MEQHRVDSATIDDYATQLIEPTRSPSRGGNGRAWHRHQITIAGEQYSWLGLGFRQWIYKGDMVSFVWQWDASKRYRNIDPDSLVVVDKNGNQVERGERGSKPWRTAAQRAPVSRREWRD